MVCLFNKTIKNMLYNFISHETNTCEDKDYTWIDKSIKRLIQDKNEAYKRFKSSNTNSQPCENFQSLQSFFGVSIEALKQRYYAV